jgi:hypothetical protein
MIRTRKGFLPNVMKTVSVTDASCAATVEPGDLWVEGELWRLPWL